MNRAERRRLQKANKNKSRSIDNEIIEAIELAKMLHANNQSSAALNLLAKYASYDINSDDYFQLFTLLAFQKQEYKQAEKVLLKAVQKWPRNPDYLNALGTVYENMDQMEKAIDYYHKTTDINPNHQNAFYNLGNVYKSLNYLNLAVDSFLRALEINPDDAEAINNLASTYIELERDEAALELFLKLESLKKPDYRSTRLLGVIYENLGNFIKAEEKYRQALTFDPTKLEIYRLLTRIKKYQSIDDEEIKKIKELHSVESESKENKIHLSFALANIYEYFKQYDRAFYYFEMANKLERSCLNYSISDTETHFSRIKSTYNKLSIEKLDNRFEETSFVPIFILGMPRSGTTLTEQIISSHSKVSGGGEIQIITSMLDRYFTENKPIGLLTETLDKVYSQYIQEISKLNITSGYLTDKMPHNFQYIGFIKLLFPNAIFINTQRIPLDNCWSIYKNYFVAHHSYAWDLDELGQYYTLYTEVMEFWSSNIPGIYELKYEQLVSDTETEVTNLLNHCGLDWEEQCLEFHKNKKSVKTASSAQVRQKIYNTSVGLSDKYGDSLKPLMASLS